MIRNQLREPERAGLRAGPFQCLHGHGAVLTGSFAYRAGTPVLDSLTADLPQGCTVLLGPNGAGKSALLSLGASCLAPGPGSVTLGRLDSVRRRDRRAFRRKVGRLPQEVKAIPALTVREQAAYTGWLKGLRHGDARVDAHATQLGHVPTVQRSATAPAVRPGAM
ncbi:ATP-binding cassette domain-containing protein [Streptomyces halstedii]|uniref:ATP-binding cassette domain-containing protein n=1 Tax=Streptomyces halstedii TaxID=1944 RepID=UPI0033B70D7D